jgi:hypothetical protein
MGTDDKSFELGERRPGDLGKGAWYAGFARMGDSEPSPTTLLTTGFRCLDLDV